MTNDKNVIERVLNYGADEGRVGQTLSEIASNSGEDSLVVMMELKALEKKIVHRDRGDTEEFALLARVSGPRNASNDWKPGLGS